MIDEVSFIVECLVKLARGLPLTLRLAAASVGIGFALALLVAAARRSGLRALEWPARAYVFAWRGTPLLAQIYLIYYGPGQFEFVRKSVAWPLLRDPYWCALIALSLVTAAYGSEVIRGGLEGVPRNLVEAGSALGLRRWQLYRLVIIPLAVRIALPGYGNEIVIMIKATSLASVITLMDVTGIAYRLISETYRMTTIFVLAGSMYLLVNSAVVGLFRIVEGRLRTAETAAKRPLRTDALARSPS